MGDMKHILRLLLLLVVGTTHAQTSKMIKEGDKAMNSGDFTKASNWFLQAHGVDAELEEVNFKLSLCFIELHQGSRAKKHIDLALQKTDKPSPEYLYTKASALQLTHQFDSAAIYYQKSDPYNKNKRAISKKIIECQSGTALLKKPVPYRIKNLSRINSKHHDLAPNITIDGRIMYFTSQRSKDEFPENIYMALNRGGAWTSAVNIGAPLNSELNDACLGLSPDGQTMYIYKGVNGGDIFESELKGDRWSTPKPMSFNTAERETSITIGPDGKELYFVRQSLNDRGEKVGSSDIYICRKNSAGNWSKATKLGGGINTIYDEESPYLHSDGERLFFSSKGHNSMGGHDVFVTKRTDGVWSKPINLGYPLNTASDERNFVLEADGKYGYYASEKEKGGKGGLDLYWITMPVGAKPNLALLSGKIIDEVTQKPIEAKITITDNDKNEVLAEFHSNELTGEYLVSLPAGKNYGVTIEKEKHLFHSENIYLVKRKGYNQLTKDVQLLNISKGSKVVLNNIFFRTGSYQLGNNSNPELTRLVKLMKQNPKIQIEIAGHTDNVGDENSNKTLSKNRAEAVKRYLVAKGIPAQRISSRGYGSAQPIADNSTSSGRSKNRRTEFIILE